MKSKIQFKDKRYLASVEDLLRDESVRVIGVIADKNQGKSNLLYHMIDIIQKNAPQTQIVGFRLSITPPGVLSLNTLVELSMVHDSVIIIDELKTLVDTDNRTEMRKLMTILQTLYHPYRNNRVILCGLAHNFNGKLSGELEAIIFKQTTLISVVQRSRLDYVLRQFTAEGEAVKNEFTLVMPRDGALIYHPGLDKQWHYVKVPYMRDYDVKASNKPVIQWQ
jgi:hypothetical protein